MGVRLLSSTPCPSSLRAYHGVVKPVVAILLSTAIALLAGASAAGVDSHDPVLIAVGDIARCESLGDEATAALVDALPGTVATLGDTVYENGTADEFGSCFAPSWGRHAGRIRPAVGNHEYGTPGAAGYFGFFGAAAGPPNGWYSYDLGSWHVVVLNSNCAEIGGCAARSAQVRWLRSDLARHPSRCTIAYMHQPRFSSGQHGGDAALHDLWKTLASGGADVLLGAHDHHYERFAPRGPAGARRRLGLRQFVVGTGGGNLRPLLRSAHGSEARDDSSLGVLVLRLSFLQYSWRFLEANGETGDAGSSSCQ